MGMEFTFGGSWWRGYDGHSLRLLLVGMTSGGGGGSDDKVCRWWGQRWKMKIKMLFADCYVDDAPKKHPPCIKNNSNEQKFKYEKEKSHRQWIIAIVDCSIPPPNTRILGVTPIHWAPPPHQPCWRSCSVGYRIYLIVEYYIHHITINFHVDDDVMKKKQDLSSRDACERSIRCAEPRRLSIGRGLLAPILVRSHFS